MEPRQPDRMHDNVRPAEFRDALGQFATGVTVIAALDKGGQLHGLTANAFSAVSLSPPLVLACVNYEARCFPVIRSASQLAIHILSADHGDIAKGFARKGADRGEVCGWSQSARGLPLLHDYAIALECQLKDVYPGGDHAILVSEVLTIHRSDRTREPLLYYQGELMPLSRS